MTSTSWEYGMEKAAGAPVQADSVQKILDSSLVDFDRIIRHYAAFNAFFLTLCGVEILLLATFFAALSHSFILALSLSVVFFTIFAYYTLRIYFQTKKPEQFRGIKSTYLQMCKGMMSYEEGSPDYFAALANACCKFANKLHTREYSVYALPAFLKSFAPWMERVSCWMHWRDIHNMKEIMLREAVAEQIKFVKSRPTDLQAHAALANAYVMLSGLYIDPRKLEGYDEERWIPKGKYGEVFSEMFRVAAGRAIEEFKILSEYAPNDPWVHSQLAYSYHDLQMPMEEIREYETIQKLLPNDMDNLYKLGMLYFQQGLNAKGLRVYEELLDARYSKAESLIKHYGSGSKIG